MQERLYGLQKKSLKYLLSGALMESQPTPGLEQGRDGFYFRKYPFGTTGGINM